MMPALRCWRPYRLSPLLLASPASAHRAGGCKEQTQNQHSSREIPLSIES